MKYSALILAAGFLMASIAAGSNAHYLLQIGTFTLGASLIVIGFLGLDLDRPK